jgi:hypothetical protein
MAAELGIEVADLPDRRLDAFAYRHARPLGVRGKPARPSPKSK